jgi:hypothetical protein
VRRPCHHRKGCHECRSYREHPIVDARPGRVGAAGVLSLDVHVGPPGFRSLRVRCAPPSLAALAPTARSRPPSAPPGSRMADVNKLHAPVSIRPLNPGFSRRLENRGPFASTAGAGRWAAGILVPCSGSLGKC